MTDKSKETQSIRVVIHVIVAFAIYYVINEFLFNALQAHIRTFLANRLAAFVAAYLLVGMPLFVATWLINRRLNIFRDLGFMTNPWIGIGFAVICTLPMFAGYAFMAGGLASGLSVTVLVANNLLAGVFEETYFRGFLFGQLFRKTRLGFLPAIILCSILFAAVHLYQSTDPKVLVGILSITFLGSVLFAWLYVEWAYNIWVPICLHALMNTSWYIFATGPDALGSGGANTFRLLTVVFAIALTVLYKIRTKQPFMINGATLWRRPASAEGTDTLASGTLSQRITSVDVRR